MLGLKCPNKHVVFVTWLESRSLNGWEIDIVSLMSGLEGVAIRTNSSDTKKMD